MDNSEDDPWKGLKARPLDDISEEAFLESVQTGDPNFAIVVLAIGQWLSRSAFQNTGPDWALKACQWYFAESIGGTRKISTRPLGSPGRTDDGRVLELVALLLIDPDVRVERECFDGGAELSQNRAVRIAISEVRGIPRQSVEQSEINRIGYHWKIDKDRRLALACEAYGRKVMANKPLLPK